MAKNFCESPYCVTLLRTLFCLVCDNFDDLESVCETFDDLESVCESLLISLFFLFSSFFV